jgi:division protein CdvB (Snf7/Vps24/ESCRT-III family)
MENVSNTFLSINEVKKQINDSRLIMEQKHRDLFVKCVRAQQAKESAFTAVVYAFQCAQAKKIAQLVITNQLDLERVVLRAGTAKDFCDTAAKLTPIIQKVSEGLAGVIPEASMRLEQIGETLDNLVLNARNVSPQIWATPSLGRDHEKIFVGFGVVDEKMREDLHPLPTDGLFLDEMKKSMYT